MNRIDDVLELFRRAADDRERGASEIEEELVRELLALGAPAAPEALAAGADILARQQPAMANLRSLAARAAAPGFNEWLERRAGILDELPRRFAANARSHIEGAERVVTISRSSAVAAVVGGARERGWKGLVVVLDGTSTGGGQDQARRLRGSGRALSRPDATAPSWLDTSAVVVVVGADAVGPRRFVNAAGTTMLMELAAARGVERVLAADTGKDVSDEILDDIIASLPIHREAPDREWPVFETIPMSLVSTRITE